jgi:AcrR family transcriptional regulator
MGPSPSITTRTVRERLTGAQRRAAILDAAIELFASRGFRGTTTREIAAAVGVTEPVLYQHFQTKRALYDAILDARVKEIDERAVQQIREAAAAGNIREFFILLGGVFFDWYLNDPRYPRLLMYAALEKHEISDMFYERKVVQFYELVTSYIRQHMESGKLRPMDPLVAARAFGGMLSHQGLIYAIYRPGDLPASRDDMVSTLVDIFLQGIEKQDI